MGTPGIDLQLRGRRRLALQLQELLVHRGRADVILAAADEQERRARRVRIVDRSRRRAAHVRERRLEERPVRPRDVVLPVDRVRLLLAERVREAPSKLLLGQRAQAVAVERILQRRETRTQRRRRQQHHALRRPRSDRDSGDTEAAVEQELREDPAERVADDDRRPVEAANDLVVVVDDRLDPEPFQRRRITARFFRIPDPRPGRCDRAIATIGVVVDPAVPAPRRHPHAVDQDNGL